VTKEPSKGQPPLEWDLRTQGAELLKHLGDLAMQAEANIWVSSALFGAAEGVLLIACFSAVSVAYTMTLVGYSNINFLRTWDLFIALSGETLAIAWAGVLMLLVHRRNRWTSKATDLQSQVGIPERFAPWRVEPLYSSLSELIVLALAWFPFTAIWFFLLRSLVTGT
jgi:hypothetical protein